MDKVKKIFNSFILTFVLVGAFVCGITFYGLGNKTAGKARDAFADTNYEDIVNNLPEYFAPKVDANSTIGNDGNSLFLLASDGSIQTQMANGTVDGEEKTSNGTKYLERNWAYYPDKENDINTFYYFNFENTLSLYYNKTNTDIDEGNTDTLENLLDNQPLSRFANVYYGTEASYDHAEGFPINGYDFVPKNFKIDFKLDTTKANVEFGANTETDNANKHVVTLNKEGCYTLVVPYTYYLTNDGGDTFIQRTTSTIKFTFMIFNSATYLNPATKLPNVDTTLMSESSLINNAVYSRYYFYNYSSTELDNTNPENPKAKLPTYSYDPRFYELTINHIDIDDGLHTATIKLETNAEGEYVLVPRDSNGNIVASPVEYRIFKDEASNSLKCILSLNNLGTYNISFDFIYKNNEKTYNLPLSTLDQRIYMFGYQALYTSQDRDELTHQTISKELKQINSDSTFEKSADITSISGSTQAQNASSWTTTNTNNVKAEISTKLKSGNSIKAISTNQTPVKLRKNNNVELDTSLSKIYKVAVDENGYATGIGNETGLLNAEENYTGDNLKDAGTYLVIAVYKFKDYLSSTGTQLSGNYHYQIFYLTITDTTPTVTITDTKGKTLYTGGYTNQSVVIVDNSASADYDANVELSIEARNYNLSGNVNHFNERNFTSFTKEQYEQTGIVYTTDLSEYAGDKYKNKTGLFVNNTGIYHNGEFTVYIKSANSSTPSSRSFTIDTNEIGKISAQNVSFLSNTNYEIKGTLDGNITNQPLIFSWNEKNSGVPTYGYFKYFELKEASYYYDSTNIYNNSTLLKALTENKNNSITPVNAILDLSNNSGWSRYSNTNTYKDSKDIPASYVRSSAGLYIFEVYDDAGNYNFEVFLIDNTSPTFVKKLYTKDTGNYDLYVLTGSETITVNDAYENSILWGDKKAIYIKGFDIPYDIENAPIHLYGHYSNDGIDELTQNNTPIKEVVNKFLNHYTSKVNNINITQSTPSDLIPSFNGRYLTIDINDLAYIKEIQGDYHEYYGYTDEENGEYIANAYKINFFKENGEPFEGSYKFLLRDEANTKGPHSAITYKNSPSGFLTINVSADSSKLEFILNNNDSNPLSPSGYDMTGKFYNSKDENNDILVKNNLNGDLTTSNLSYKYTYYSPIKTNFPLSLSYIPYAEDGSMLQTLSLTYYEYERKSQVVTMTGHSNNTYKAQVYYYGFKEMPSRNINIFQLTQQNQGTLNKGQREKFPISFGTTDGTPAPGKYVITRIYASDTSSNNQYDYYERNLVLIIDDKNIISSLEEISNDKLIGNDGYEYTNSLESLVGGDITIGMYAEEGNSSRSDISISFPGYNANTGLNEGSLYTTSSMTEGSTPSVALTSNKVPLSVKIPKYKYTINNQYNFNNNSYSVNINNANSYYGDIDMVIRKVDEREYFDVYTNLVYKTRKDEANNDIYVIDTENSLLLESFDRKSDAEDYITSWMQNPLGPSISEYELYAKIAYYQPNANEPSGYDRNPSAWYRTNKETQDNYLKFFIANSEEGDMPANAEEIKEFKNPGRYVVTMYQASNQTSMEGDAYFGSLYKFAFVIASPTPDFQVLTTNGNELDSTTLQSEIRYYTNEKNLRVRWTDDDSEFMAKIAQNSIYVTPYNGNTPLRQETIELNRIQHQEGSNTYWFDYDLTAIWNNGNKIAISMQYEGLDNSRIIKYVHIDYSAPLEILETLSNATTNSTTNSFSRLFQERNMRSLYTSEGTLIDVSIWKLDDLNDELEKVSYSYSNGSGNFRYYAYTVAGDFFDNVYDAIRNNVFSPEKTQNVYFKSIDTSTSGEIFSGYTQVTKESFSRFDGNYTNLKEAKENNINLNLTNDTYYEVVELDTAGNMVVYIVYYNNNLDKEIALSYTNKTLQQKEENERIKTIENSQIQDGFNIYSNSGFQLTSLNYNKDAWGFFTTSIYGTTRFFMRSPWLTANNQVYEIGGNGTNMTFTPINISEIFEDVSSGQRKHNMTFSNRTTGTRNIIYISVMDAMLETAKRSTTQTATLQITVPTYEQMQSTTYAYVTPRKITISRYETNGGWNSETLDGAIVESGNPQDWLAFNRDFLAFNYNGNYLEITITVQNNSSTKFKYEIEDNFGNTTTIVQLINEETCEEVVGTNTIYTNIEGDSSTTYLSSGNLTYQYNSLLYTAKVVRIIGGQGQENTNSTLKPNTNNIRTITITNQGQLNYDKVYVIEVYESENYIEGSQFNKPIKIVNLRIYNRLPVLSDKKGGDDNQNNIWFLDKNNQTIQTSNGNGTVESIPSLSFKFKNQQFTSPATSITTFSSNVTIGFNDGQNMTNSNDLVQYPYSVYVSTDRENWTNINEYTGGYIVSGTGSYFVLATYDNESIFTTECRLFMVNILNSSSISYYFHVDGLPVEPRANFKYTAPNGEEFSTVYVLSVNYEDKDARVVIEPNKELNTIITSTLVDDTNSARAGVRVEIYTYNSKISKNAKFAVVYIGESSQILTRLSYENATGSNVDLLQSNDPANPSPIVALAEETGFDKLKITWNSYYGIKENDINVIVEKNFNGRLEEINTTIYKDGNTNYIYLTRAGTYRLTFQDSCENPNTQLFGRYEFINITFLNSVPFTMTYTDPISNEEIVSEPINRAIYNGSVKLSLTNPADYFASGYPIIKVMKDGQEYTNFTTQGVNNYIFSENGYYSISFEAVSVNQEEVRRETFVFSIINANESRYTFEFSTYANYYVKSIFKDGYDVTQKFISTIDDAKVTFDNINYYFTNLQISYFDEKTGSGRYVITIETGEQTFKNIATSPTSFTFAFRINLASPPIIVDLEEGGSTTNPIKVTYNLKNMYETVGDCIVRIPGQSPIVVNADTIAQGQETITADITVIGTNYVQVYTMSGNLLFSYKVTRTEPLNVWAIIAIVIGVIIVGIVIFITIKLRKRLKVK